MNDFKSILGYSRNSPYKSDPFIDIFTPEGLIDMSNTDIDILGMDNKGNKKKMKARSKNPYKFEGDIVREIPVGKKGGYYDDGRDAWVIDGEPQPNGPYGNPYMQQGGIQDLYNYLFDDDEPAPTDMPTAPSTEEIDNRERQVALREKQLQEQEQYNLAIQVATEDFDSPAPQAGVNPYLTKTQQELMSSYKVSNLGIWGDKSHQQRRSDHNTGDAQDFSFDTHETAQGAIADLMSRAKERKVKYIIYNGQIWNPSVSDEWRPYSGTNPHKSHFHVSYNR